MKKLSAKSLTKSAVIAALYVALTLLLAPISFSGLQVRVSEAMTILPLFMPEAVFGLSIGCLIANFFGNGPLDIVFGTLATIVSSLITYFIGRKIRREWLKITLGCIPPIIINAIVVPFTFLALTELKELYFLNALSVGIGQFLAVVCLGVPVYFIFKRYFYKNTSVNTSQKHNDPDSKADIIAEKDDLQNGDN